MYLCLLVIALVVVLVCIAVYSLTSQTEGFSIDQVSTLGAEPAPPEEPAVFVAPVDGNVTALIPFANFQENPSFSVLSHYKNPLISYGYGVNNIPLQKVSSIILPFRDLRSRLSWIFPLLYSGKEITLSPAIANYYARSLGMKKRVATLQTQNNILGDIYPLSIRDDGGTINPYDTQTGILTETGFSNLYEAEVLEFGGFPQVATRVEINKSSPVPFVVRSDGAKATQLSASDSAKRIYSNPDAGTSCITGLAQDDNYVPSRLKPDFALLTPFLSPNNLVFGSTPAVYSKTSPSYANKSGATGTSLPAADYYYSENSCSKSRLSWLNSQSFDLPAGANGIIANLLLNPYIPVRKSGNANTQVVLSSSIPDRKKWYEKTFRGRVRCSVQARLSSLTGSIAYFFDSMGNMVFVEPIRAFNFPQATSTKVSPLESLYFSKGATETAVAKAEADVVNEREKAIAVLNKDIDDDYRSKQDRIAKANAAIASSYTASENAYNNMVAESNRNIENTRTATRNGIANQTRDSNAKIASEWNKVSSDVAKMRQEIVDRQKKCDDAVQAKINDLNKAIAAGKKQSDIDNLRKKVDEQRTNEAGVCGKYTTDHTRKINEKLATYNRVKAEEEAKIAQKTREEDAKLAAKITEERGKQAEKRAHETRVHGERTAHEQKIIADELRKHNELKTAKLAEIAKKTAEFDAKVISERARFFDKNKYPPALMANTTLSVLNQSIPVIAPFSLFEGKVLSLESLTNVPQGASAKGLDLSLSADGPIVGAVRSVNNVYFDFSTSSASLKEALTGATPELLSNGKLPLGGFEFLSPYNSTGELLGASFTDQTKRTFLLDSATLAYGSHGALPKSSNPGYNDYILNQYTHNYYFPWAGSHLTKYIVVENCTANTKNLIALGLFLRKYSTASMDPMKTEPVLQEDIFCYYPTTDVNAQYSTYGGVPSSRLVDPSRSFPKGREFLTDDNSLKAGPYPLIGAPHFSREQDWWKGAGGQDQYLLPDDGGQQASSTALTSGRAGTASKTVVIVLREPALLYSLNYISRTFAQNTKDEFERIATTGFNLTDKDVTFRNCNYVTVYNNNTQCISSCTINDSFVDSTGTSGTVSMSMQSSAPGDFNTNLLSVATFGPTTVLETSEKYEILP